MTILSQREIISEIVHGQRTITADTALRLGRYFGTSAAVWLRMQVAYDLELAEKEFGERISREVKVYQQTAIGEWHGASLPL